MYGCFKFKKLIIALICVAITVSCFFTVKNFQVNALPAVEDNGIFLPIIMYHSVLKDVNKSGKFIVTPQTLEEDLKYLEENGYSTIFVKDLVDYVYNNKKLPKKPVILTFDDGYYNNETYVLPLLEKYDMKAVISVVGSFTDRFSQQDDHQPAYSHLTWDDICELSESGYVEIGNHTYDMHNNNTRNGCGKKACESVEEYEKCLISDVSALQNKLLEKVGEVPVTFTYPYGFISRESIPILKNLGIKATLTCYEKPNYITKNPNTLFGLNRYNRPSGISTEDFMKKVLLNNN
ncbi:MAG: polysaccharide deacetylase family protein [Oscillospiraceae bacterium]